MPLTIHSNIPTTLQHQQSPYNSLQLSALVQVQQLLNLALAIKQNPNISYTVRGPLSYDPMATVLFFKGYYSNLVLTPPGETYAMQLGWASWAVSDSYAKSDVDALVSALVASGVGTPQ